MRTTILAIALSISALAVGASSAKDIAQPGFYVVFNSDNVDYIEKHHLMRQQDMDLMANITSTCASTPRLMFCMKGLYQIAQKAGHLKNYLFLYGENDADKQMEILVPDIRALHQK